MCLDGVNNFYVKHFWDFNHVTFGEQSVSWWDVNTFKANYYLFLFRRWMAKRNLKVVINVIGIGRF